MTPNEARTRLSLSFDDSYQFAFPTHRIAARNTPFGAPLSRKYLFMFFSPFEDIIAIFGSVLEHAQTKHGKQNDEADFRAINFFRCVLASFWDGSHQFFTSILSNNRFLKTFVAWRRELTSRVDPYFKKFIGIIVVEIVFISNFKENFWGSLIGCIVWRDISTFR